MSSRGTIGAIIVTYHPSSGQIRHLARIREQVDVMIVVDNGSATHELAELRAAESELHFTMIENGENIGIAAALNAGVIETKRQGCRWVVLFDQDSVITDGFVSCMIADFEAYRQHKNILQIVPRYIDPETGAERPVSAYHDGGVFLSITSGSLFPMETFAECGLFNEDLFIYCVDDDYSLRLRKNGYFIGLSRNAILMHQSGHPSTRRIFGRTITTRNYRPEARYYYARNKIRILSTYGRRFPRLILPTLRELVSIPLKILLMEDASWTKVKFFVAGLRDGLLGRTGRARLAGSSMTGRPIQGAKAEKSGSNASDGLPRNILFVHHANDMYGADIGLLHSIRSLDFAKYHPIVILPSDMPTGMLSAELDRMGVEYHFAPLGILRRKYISARSIVPLLMQLVRGSIYVRSLARKRRAALVYVNTIVTVSGAIGGGLARVPVLWHIREIVSMPRPVRWTLYKLLHICAESVVCISNAVRDSILREAPALLEKTRVIYNGVGVPSLEVAGPEVSLRRELAVPDEDLLVGMIGRISYWKGQEILAEAARLVLQQRQDVHFVAVGSYFSDQSQYLRELEVGIRSLGIGDRFHLLPYRADVGSVYRSLDVFVLPSRMPEPFGRVTVEAMMHGRAVIATNHGGTCELIQDGVTGLLVPPSDPQSLAVAIRKLLEDPVLRETMGKAAAAHAQAKFSLSRYEERIQELIVELAAGKSCVRDPSLIDADKATEPAV